MWFTSAIISAILITLAAIFLVYRLFLYQPQNFKPPLNPPAVQNTQPSENKISNPTAVTSPTPIPSVSVKASGKPKASPTPKAIIGSFTVLQNNVANQSSSQTGVTNISGLIDISGTPPSGSSIVITARQNGTGNNFQTVVDSIKAQDSENWSWTSATNGTTYDLIAVLKGKSGGSDIDYAKSPTYTLKAPSSGQVFQVDVGYSLATPTGTITVTCNNHYSNNTWSATVNYPAVEGAKYYWLQIGSTSGDTNIADISKSGQTQDTTLTDSVNYYTQYAVSSVSNPTAYQYSSFSSTQTIHCP